MLVYRRISKTEDLFELLLADSKGAFIFTKPFNWYRNMCDFEKPKIKNIF